MSFKEASRDSHRQCGWGTEGQPDPVLKLVVGTPPESTLRGRGEQRPMPGCLKGEAQPFTAKADDNLKAQQ